MSLSLVASLSLLLTVDLQDNGHVDINANHYEQRYECRIAGKEYKSGNTNRSYKCMSEQQMKDAVKANQGGNEEYGYTFILRHKDNRSGKSTSYYGSSPTKAMCIETMTMSREKLDARYKTSTSVMQHCEVLEGETIESLGDAYEIARNAQTGKHVPATLYLTRIYKDGTRKSESRNVRDINECHAVGKATTDKYGSAWQLERMAGVKDKHYSCSLR